MGTMKFINVEWRGFNGEHFRAEEVILNHSINIDRIVWVEERVQGGVLFHLDNGDIVETSEQMDKIQIRLMDL